MEITQFQVDWLESIEQQIETIDIDMELIRRSRGKSIAKYEGLTNNQLIAVRNHLQFKSNKTVERLINECQRIKYNSRAV